MPNPYGVGMGTQIYAGTSGYSFKAWRGTFYPSELAADQWLAYYAKQLPSVEINNTFYRMPKSHVVEQWRDSVATSFRFVIKASRRVTHQQRLRDCEETTAYLIEKTNLLGNRLGAVLFQLPPNMRLDVERLQRFQATLPPDYPAVFEFRHESWNDAKVRQTLRDHGHAQVISHDEGAMPGRLAKNDCLYVRLRAPEYSTSDLETFAQRIEKTQAKQAFVFFKHEDDASGAASAQQFMDIIRSNASSARAPKRAPRKNVDTSRSRKQAG